jgi:ribosome-binding factor A
MEFKRADRVSGLLRKEIAEVLAKKVKDPRVSMVTITGVKVSPDLRSAYVYFSVLGNEKEIKDSTIGLERATKFIQRQLGKRISLRYTPIIDFQFDKSLEYGSHIDKILQGISSPHEEDSET